jgi:hypothetical protein
LKIGPNLNSLLPNLRWLCLPSENFGEDWYDKGLEIDSLIQEHGLDLSEEVIYLLFSDSPENVLNGLGQCLVARPVIGPKKKFNPPFELIDWKALPVYRAKLTGDTLKDILERALLARNTAEKGSKPFAQDFVISLNRKLKEELFLSVEAIFHE